MSPSVFACVFCDEKLESKDALQMHFRIHATTQARGMRNNNFKRTNQSNDTSITCDVCPEVFDTATAAISHKFRKHPEAPNNYFCAWCGKQFPIKQILHNHEKTHNEPIPLSSFPCSDCDAYFHNEQAAVYHCQLFHKKTFMLTYVQTPPPSKKIRMGINGDVHSAYYCHICGHEYIVKYNLQKHIQTVHCMVSEPLPEEVIKCKMCDALFYNVKAYEFHNTFHKPTDYYVVSEEMRKQVITKIDQDFDFRRVRYGCIKNVRSIGVGLQVPLFADIGNLAAMSPPPADYDSDEEKSVKNTLGKLAENSISMDKFFRMNKNVLGDCFSKKPCKSEDQSDIKPNVKLEKMDDDVDKLAEIKNLVSKLIYEPVSSTKKNTNNSFKQYSIKVRDDLKEIPKKSLLKEIPKNSLPKEITNNSLPKNIPNNPLSKEGLDTFMPKDMKDVRHIMVPKGIIKPGIKILMKRHLEALQRKGYIPEYVKEENLIKFSYVPKFKCEDNKKM